MPVDANGLRADIIMDPNSVVHRMNLGNKYEGFMTANTKVVGNNIAKMLAGRKPSSLSKTELDKIFNYLLGYVKLFGNKQYDLYKQATQKEKVDVLSSPLQMYYPIDNVKTAAVVSKDIMESKYAMTIGKLTIPLADGKTIQSSTDIALEGNYIMLLYKIADTWLSVASTRVNALGVPISPSKVQKDRMTHNAVPTKVHSESETRMYIGFLGREPVIELRDRANNVDSQRLLYKNILFSTDPIRATRLIDREEHPFGGELPLKAITSIIKTFGENFKYIKRGGH